MEQHPVPQNVTTFQFRLIGDMTLKQFGYLCAGGILAFIAYRLPLPFFFTWPLAFGLAFLGVGFAFIPIEERPMDVWVFSFFKSIYNPTQYVWTQTPPKAEPQHHAPPPTTARTPAAKTPAAAPHAPAKADAPRAQALAGLFGQGEKLLPDHATPQPQKAPHIAAKPHSPSLFAWLRELWSPSPKTASHPHSVPAPSPARIVQQQPLPPVTGRKLTMTDPAAAASAAQKPSSEEILKANQKISELEASLKSLQDQLAEKNNASQRIVELQTELTHELKEKSSVENELVSLRRKMDSTEKPAPASPPAATTETAGPTVKIINTQDAAVKIGLPRLTTYPNVITGIVKDGTNNLLPGILVTVTNGEGVPMRALKTNKLGQFAASTPLSSGTYFVEIEDPRDRFSFNRVQLTLSGAVTPALEIIAKSQKQLTREKLAQEIFGSQKL